MKRVPAFCFALFLTLSLMVPVLSVSVCAAEADGFSAVPNDAWEGGSAQFTGKDGSVTTVYDSGSVVTEYPDGRTFGVDYLGNKHSKDKDGTYTVTGKNGDVARENPDGTQELTEANGKKLIQNPDGSGKTVYPSGLVIEHNSEHTPTAVFFEGGKERLEADESGRFPNGEIAGPDGKKLINTEDGLEMTGKNGTRYSVTNLEDGPGSASVVHADGSYVKYENGQAEMRLSDGSSFTYTDDGKGKWSMADGSYLYRDDLSKAWGQYDAASGFQVECNENGELVNLYTTSDNGGVLRIKDGELVEWEDPDSGISVKQAEDGSVTASVTTEEGTYSADGSGNVWLNGKQIKKDGELIVDGGSSGSSEHSPSEPRPADGTSDDGSVAFTLKLDPTEYNERSDGVYDGWGFWVYLSFYKAGEIPVTRLADGTLTFTLPGHEYVKTDVLDRTHSVSVPSVTFVGSGFDAEKILMASRS